MIYNLYLIFIFYIFFKHILSYTIVNSKLKLKIYKNETKI